MSVNTHVEEIHFHQAMGELFAEGGHLFWVAPSGGRDRPDPDTKQFAVAPFDVKSVDMFKVLALQSKKVIPCFITSLLLRSEQPLHLFPMAMYTNKLIPPPDTLSSTLGESRNAKRGAVSMHLLDEINDLGGFKDKYDHHI